MNDKGNRYAISALRDQRARLAGEIVLLKKRLAWAQGQLVHVDATLHLLDPLTNPGTIPAKRPQKRIKLFRQGELSRLVVDTLRRAKKPLGTHEVITALLELGGFGEEARPALGQRVRGNLAYLEKTKRIVKAGHWADATWALNAKS